MITLEEVREIERKWQEKWQKEKIFEANPDKRKKKYFITWPYPYTSGPLHIGHGRTATMVDIIARYKRLEGYNVLFPLAFHVTGTPVLAIADKIRRDDWKTLQLYKEYIKIHTKDEKRANEILSSFTEPENIMKYFSQTYITDLNSIGFSIDWRRKFTTTDPEYNKFVEWQFYNLKEKGYLKKGEYPVLYCTVCKNAVGEDDIKSGDTIKPRVEEFNIIKFKCGDAYLVPATLRPETIFGVTNLWINPDGNYVKIKIGKEKWILSKEAAEKLKYQEKEFEVIERFKGKALIGKKCEEPIKGRKVPILPAKFVDTDNATGVVYSVPAHAPYDYIALRDLGEKIDLISIIKVEGFGEFPAKEIVEKYGIKNQEEKEKLDEATEELYKEEFYNGVLKENTGKYKGKKISEVKEQIIKDFKKKGILEIFYEATGEEKPVCRCGGKVVAAVLKDQWFIDYGNEKWKEKTKKHLKEMKIIPEKYRKQFEDAIDWVHERPCARRRGLGTKLPFDKNWIIESLSDSTIYMAFYTVIHKIRENEIDAEKLSREFWDFVFLGKGKIEEISEKTGIKKELLKEMREEFEYWYPVDQRHTGTPHIPNHLIFYIFNHVAIFPKEYWPIMISLNELIIREGRKMSKSLGNVIPLANIEREYSADAYRLYNAYAADLSSVMDWKDKEIQSVISKLLNFYEISKMIIEDKKEEKKKINEWFESRFYTNLLKAKEDMGNLKIRDYVQKVFYNIMNDLSYFRRRGGNLGSLKELLSEWVIYLSPIIPHLSEEIWHKLGKETFVSLEEAPKIKKSKINEEAEIMEEIVKTVNEDINRVIKLVGKEPKEIKLFVAGDWKYKLYQKMIELQKSGKVTEANKILMKDEEIRKRGNDAVKIINKLTKDPSKIPSKLVSKEKEMETLKDAKDFLEKEFKAKVEIMKEEETKEAKAKQALPGKPAIILVTE